MNKSAEFEQECLSAFVDGELSPKEQDGLSRRLRMNAALRRCLSRYQRIGAVLRQQPDNLVDASGVADLVSLALNDEPTVLAPRRLAGGLPRVALGAALAASVAAISVSVAPNLFEIENDVQPGQLAFAPRLSAPALPVTRVAFGDNATVTNYPIQGNWKVLQPSMRRKLDNYLLEHNEYAGQLGVAPVNAHVGILSSHDE